MSGSRVMHNESGKLGVVTGMEGYRVLSSGSWRLSDSTLPNDWEASVGGYRVIWDDGSHTKVLILETRRIWNEIRIK